MYASLQQLAGQQLAGLLSPATSLSINDDKPRQKRRSSVRQRLNEAAVMRRYGGREVYVYHNADRGSWSIKTRLLEQGRWVERDICHPDRVLLKDARFDVDSPKRERMFASGRRNQHAGIWGTLVAIGDDTGHQAPGDCQTPVLYRPMLRGDFHTRNGQSVGNARYVLLDITQPDSNGWVLAAGVTGGETRLKTPSLPTQFQLQQAH